MARWLSAAAVAWLVPFAAAAEGVLDGQQVSLRALVIEQAGAAPRLASRSIEMVAGPGIELPSMQQMRATWGDDPGQIVEISVDLEADSIVIAYGSAGFTQYTDGFFAGYEFRLPGLPLALIDRAELDLSERLPGMSAADLTSVPGALWLNVAGRWVDPQSRIRIRFPAAPVPAV